MKRLSIVILACLAAVSSFFLFKTDEIVHEKQAMDNCLELEAKLVSEGGSESDWQRLKDCQARQAARLGLDRKMPEDAFLGDEANAPEGSYAYFHGFGQNAAITVFEDRVEYHSQFGFPQGLQVIPFSKIIEIELEPIPVPTIEITYNADKGMVFTLSVSLYTRGTPLYPDAGLYTRALFDLLRELKGEPDN